MRTIYHTHIKHLAREGLLSLGTLQLIPRSNIYRWKTEPPTKYKTFGINLSEDFELVKAFAQNRNAKRVFSAYVRIIGMVIRIAHNLRDFHSVVKQNSKQIIEIINRVRPYIGLQTILRFFNISVPTFRQWSLQSLTACFNSITGDCNRIFPNQLSKSQILTLRELLADPRFQFWPVSSIAWYALRYNILSISLNTWYKYVHKLGIKRVRPLSRRKKTLVGIRAIRPHQIWHADISIFVTQDQIKHYIYCVVDNFSRKILNCIAYDSVKADLRRATLLDAMRNIEVLSSPVTLITDSGPENCLSLSDVHPPMFEHLKAMVDIQYSNSMIEAHNKILKYNYLYRMEIKDIDQLNAALPKIVEDFNNRPHVSLGGLTPNEAEQNMALDTTVSKNIRQATQERKIYNQLHQCGHCRG